MTLAYKRQKNLQQIRNVNVHTNAHQGYPPGLDAEGAGKNMHLTQFLPRRHLSTYFTSSCLRIQKKEGRGGAEEQ